MNVHQAHQLAIDLMTEHGLVRDGWRFKWSSGKRQLGAAEIQRRTDPLSGRPKETKSIKLSRHLVALNDEVEVRDTILHEIAHAIVGIDHGHDHAWKAACREIGARPQRLAGEDVNLAPPTYAIVCGQCQRVLGKRYRRMRPDRLNRAYCEHCGPESLGALTLEPASEI